MCHSTIALWLQSARFLPALLGMSSHNLRSCSSPSGPLHLNTAFSCSARFGASQLCRPRALAVPAYAGIIEIEWSEVQSINSDEVLELSLQNGMVLTGTVHAAEAGMEISSSPGMPMSAHNIKAISKPRFEQTFRNRVDS